MTNIDSLIAGWKQQRASLERELAMFESGKAHVGTNILDNKTKESIARVKDWIATLDALIAEHSK
jgi:hypothetical protein